MSKADQFLPPFNVKWYRLPEYLKELNSFVTFSDLNSADRIISGGVVWKETNLDFESSEIIYTIDNVKYVAPPRQLITLETTGAGLDRIDVFYVDKSGQLKVRQGQESNDPSEPDIIEGEELKVSFVIIRDGQVVPEGITNETIYNENLQVVGGEWNTSTPQGTINLASTADAQDGSVSIFFNSANFRDKVVFNNDVVIPGASIDTLVFRVKLTNPSTGGAPRLFAQVSNSITSTLGPGVVINDGQYGFNSTAYNSWQTIIIPASVLGVAQVNPDELTIRCYRRGMSFFLDNILFQSGIPAEVLIPEYTLDLVGSDLNLRKDDTIVSIVDLSTFTPPTPSLQAVTDVGNTTTNSISIGPGTNTLPSNTVLAIGQDIPAAYRNSIFLSGEQNAAFTNNITAPEGYQGGNFIMSDVYLGKTTSLKNQIFTSIVSGFGNVAGVDNVGFGINNFVVYASLISGIDNELTAGKAAALIGTGLKSGASRALVVGSHNRDITQNKGTVNTNTSSAYNPRFIVGTSTNYNENGKTGTPMNGFVVMSDGHISAPRLTTTMIDTPTIPTMASGTTDGTIANKLVDSTKTFLSTVMVGDIVRNTTDTTTATVTAVDSDTTLSLDADIMISGENYVIDLGFFADRTLITREWFNANTITPTLQTVTDAGNTTTLNIAALSFNQLELFAQTGVDVDNIGIGINALNSNSGTDAVAIGTSALQNNTANSVTAVGRSAGQSNSGGFATVIGAFAGLNNTGNNLTAIGYSAGSDSTGFDNVFMGRLSGANSASDNSVAVGVSAGRFTVKDDGVFIGDSAGIYNRGLANVNIGLKSGELSTNDNSVFIGHWSGRYEVGLGNTVIGHNSNSTFNDDVANLKNVASAATDVDTALNRITITAHGFGATNSYVILKYSTTGTPIGGLNNGLVYQFQIIDANTIQYVSNLSSVGTDTHTFTPQFIYNNVTVLGASAEATKSNQVTLGDSNVTEVKTSGTYVSGGYTVATLPTGVTGARAYVTDSNVTASGNFGATVAGGGANVVPVFYDGSNWIIA